MFYYVFKLQLSSMFVFALNLSSHILLRYYDKAIKNIIMIHFINCLKLLGKPNNSYWKFVALHIMLTVNN